MPYICPLCTAPLSLSENNKSYACEKNHHFDIAKEGYLNLLPAQHKKSKDPGDNKTMMRARRDFLEAGFYQNMAAAITQMIQDYAPNNSPLRLLDMGCGEGYYSRHITAHYQPSENLELHGVDIAKNAILAAAKKQKNAHFVVASSHNLPYPEHFFDLLLRVYAPSDDQEINRILKEDGLLIIATPGPRHLWQLKEFIYQDVNEHSLTAELPEQFEILHSERVHYRITPSSEQRMALLQMTPFAWRASPEVQLNIAQLSELEIEADFILTLARKK